MGILPPPSHSIDICLHCFPISFSYNHDQENFVKTSPIIFVFIPDDQYFSNSKINIVFIKNYLSQPFHSIDPCFLLFLDWGFVNHLKNPFGLFVKLIFFHK